MFDIWPQICTYCSEHQQWTSEFHQQIHPIWSRFSFCTILCSYVSEFILFYSYLLIILFISTVVIVFDNTSVLLPWKHISPFVGHQMNSDSDSCWIKSPVLIKSANKNPTCRQRASEQTSWWHLILIHVIRASLLNNIQKQAGSKGGHMSKHQNWDLIQICSVSDAFWDLCRGLSGKWSGTLSESCFLVLKESLNVSLWQEADQRWRSEVSDVRLTDGCRIWNLTSHHVSPHDMKLRVKLTSGVLCGWDLSCVTCKDLIKHWWSSQSSLHCLHYQKISSRWAAHLRVRSPEPEWRRPRRRRRWAARSGEPAADSSSLCPGRPLKTRETKPAHLMIRDVKHHYVTEWRHGSARYTDWSRQIKTQLNNKYIDSVLLLHF